MCKEQKRKIAEMSSAERLLELYDAYTHCDSLVCTEEERKETAEIIKAEILNRMSR